MLDDAMTAAGDPSPRARRIPSDEVRSRLIAAARDALSRDGITVGFSHLPMEEYIRLAGVPRSSVYRIWSTREEFVAELIGEMFPHDRFADGVDPEALELMRSVYDRNQHLLADSAGRRAVAYEMIRIGTNANIEGIRRSVDWTSYNALLASTQSMEPGPAREAVLATMRRTEAVFTERMSGFYQEMLDRFGGAMRSAFSTRQLAHLTSIIIDGLALRSRLFGDDLDEVITLPGLDGEPVDWHLAAWTIRSVVDGMLEPVKDERSPVPPA